MDKKFCLVFLVCSLFFVLSCSQGDVGPAGTAGDNVAVLQFQQGVYPSDAYSGVTDAYLESGIASDTNYGNDVFLYAGRFVSGAYDGMERFLLKFDLRELQNQKIKIKKAQIILYCYIAFPTSTTMTVTPYEVTKSWIESEVTWNSSEPGIAWSSAGGDYSATQAGPSLYMDKYGEYKIFNINASVVQKWIDNPENNFGLIFVSDTESIPGNRWFGFYSRNHTNVYYRPQLIISYTLK